jgi:hypothetical protein
MIRAASWKRLSQSDGPHDVPALSIVIASAYTVSRSRGTSCPSFARRRPGRCRGRREGRVPAGTRGPLCANAQEQMHSGIQVKPETTRPSLRSGFTAYGALSSGSDALLPPSPCGGLMCAPGRAAAITARLDATLRAPGLHAFAVRGRSRSRARDDRSRCDPPCNPRRADAVRVHQSHPACRDDRDPPLGRVGVASYTIIRTSGKENYSCRFG